MTIVYTYTCETCGVEIYLDDMRVSKNGKKIPIDSRTGQPHKRHISLAQAIRRSKRIDFEKAFYLQCHTCKQHYRAVDRYCKDCWEETEYGMVEKVEDPVYGDKALIKWAIENNKEIPAHLSTSIRSKK